jgi:hypothetical protein
MNAGAPVSLSFEAHDDSAAESADQFEENVIAVAASALAPMHVSAAAAAPTVVSTAQHFPAADVTKKKKKQKDLDVIQAQDISVTAAAPASPIALSAQHFSAADVTKKKKKQRILNAFVESDVITISSDESPEGKKQQPILSASAAAVTHQNAQTNCVNCNVLLGKGHCTNCYHFKENPPLLSHKRIRVPKRQVNMAKYFAQFSRPKFL